MRSTEGGGEDPRDVEPATSSGRERDDRPGAHTVFERTGSSPLSHVASVPGRRHTACVDEDDDDPGLPLPRTDGW
jgi:hypothetical protein